jgi:hypothetical protein
MANINAAFGLRPIRNLNGSPWNGQAKKFYIPSTDTDAMFVGDPVVLAGSGDANGVPTVKLATAGATNKITGVVVGFLPAEGRTDSTLNLNNTYRPASTACYVLVCDDPDTIFEAQLDDSATPAVADIGTNFNLVAGSGSTVNGLSGWEVETSTSSTGNTLQVHLLRFVEIENQSVGASANGEFIINLHSYNRPITGV